MSDRRTSTLLTSLRRATSYAKLYGPEHPLTSTGYEEAAEAAAGLIENADRAVVAVADESLFLDGRVQATASLEFNGFLQEMQRNGIHSFTLSGRVMPDDVAAFVPMLGGIVDEYRGGPSIVVNEVSAVGDDLDTSSTGGLRRSYADSLSVLRRIGGSLRSGTKLDLAATEGTVNELLEQALAQPSAALLLATVKSHHEYTFYHSVNTCILSLAMGRLAGLPEEEQILLGMGALLHDIGKIGVSTAILQHPGRLDETQWAEIRRHPQLGAEAILAAAKPGQEVAAAVAFEHHARFDGSGYPRLVYHDHTHHDHQPHPLHYFSRLVAVADTYDAITTRRSYRRAEPPSRALHVLLSAAGSSYDPDFVMAFIHMMGVYPPGSFLRLANGRVAMVTGPSDDPDRVPDAVAVLDREGSPIAIPEPIHYGRGDVVEHLTAAAVGVEPTEVLEKLGTGA
jgi:HD-GYP domain-containing protein (c-di-GMP phosphodiesterase class II)